MKKLLFLLSFKLLLISAPAQYPSHKADLFLKVLDDTETPVPFLKTILKTETGNQPQYAVTDSKGNARFSVRTGTSYQVYIYDTLWISTLTIPLNSMSYVTQKVTLPPIPEKLRSEKTTVDTIDQSKLSIVRPDPGNIFFKIGLSNHLNQAVKNMEIRIFSENLKMVYIARTNNYGVAQFHVPGKTKYVIGVDKFEHFETVSLPHHSFGLKLTYIPTKIREYETNDTLTQYPDPSMRTTTDRALVKIHLKDHDNKALADEQVFFNVMESTRVYAGKTGKDGVLTMLLPKGYSYELHFKYERSMKRLDFPLSPTLYTSQFYMTYIGSKKVEEFYANANRTGGFRTDFMDAKASALKMEAGVLEITSRGFNLNFPDEGAILTPAISGNKLFVSAGFYSPNIYCIDSDKGTPLWGLKLAENGPSVLVIEDGMLLINTQSCTLYAIDMETGRLAWSKWLGPNIYHSPAVANGKVYTAYPDDLSLTNNRFVLAAFDLKTGAIQWQARLKNEPLAAPVVAGNYVFITDQKGYVYSFLEATGELLAVSPLEATCPPVFDGEVLWVNTQQKSSGNASLLNNYMPKSLALVKTYPNFTDSLASNLRGNSGAAALMSFSRNRVIIKQGTYYQINTKGLQAFSGTGGALKWSLPLTSNLSYNPVLLSAGKYLLASTHSTKLALIDPVKGQKVKDFYIAEILSSEPVVHNGWIYCGTKNGKLVAINTKDKAISGWRQWGMNAGHNPVIK